MSIILELCQGDVRHREEKPQKLPGSQSGLYNSEQQDNNREGEEEDPHPKLSSDLHRSSEDRYVILTHRRSKVHTYTDTHVHEEFYFNEEREVIRKIMKSSSVSKSICRIHFPSEP